MVVNPDEFNYSALDTVITGESVLSALPRLVNRKGVERVLLVASSSLATHTNQFAELQERLGTRCAGIFDRISAHTPRDEVLVALQAARDVDADLLVSLGGGSIIDACKVIQLAIDQEIHSEEALLEYVQRSDGSRGSKAGDYSLFSEHSKIRQIAIPTTLSGAELSNNAGVLDRSRSAKEGYQGIDLCPQCIIYDPELVLHTPQWLWLSTAIRSLDHAIEGYCSADSNPFLDGHFLHAMKLFAESLPLTRTDPGDQQARTLNQQAVWLACCGLGTVAHGASHGIGYILGSLFGVPHGYTSCVMLPAVLQWNVEQFAIQQDAIIQALGNSAYRPEQSSDVNAGSAVKALIASLGLPTTLRQVGVKSNQLDEIAARAIQHPVVRSNPRTLESTEQVREIQDLA
ncbi:MAG: iron-containing alcohol dehydrogenase [Gammaproteobacteria bacterium]|nr:iron-containing alcohol dehydrogenase [Gammaproteobacteria bacterium]MDP6653966.1 iron-containing alcohol dehydrogenase [Gammaproteobacteria bacterium]